MIFYLFFFLLIIGISIFLAYISMRDIYDLPEGGDVYGLFLIKNPKGLTTEVLREIQKGIKHHNQIISLERLYKGSKSALVTFGPRRILSKFVSLDLKELEDYTKVDGKSLSAWEIKKTPPLAGRLNLKEGEEVWLQYVLQDKVADFRLQMRVVHISSDPINNVSNDSRKVYKDFVERSITPLGKGVIQVSPERLLAIILLPHR